MATRFKADDIRNLCDLHTPLSDHDKEVIAKVDGPQPKHESIKRPPYDELYLKQRYNRDYWRK